MARASHNLSNLHIQKDLTFSHNKFPAFHQLALYILEDELCGVPESSQDPSSVCLKPPQSVPWSKLHSSGDSFCLPRGENACHNISDGCLIVCSLTAILGYIFRTWKKRDLKGESSNLLVLADLSLPQQLLLSTSWHKQANPPWSFICREHISTCFLLKSLGGRLAMHEVIGYFVAHVLSTLYTEKQFFSD
jgi:hypothetical protein